MTGNDQWRVVSGHGLAHRSGSAGVSHCRRHVGIAHGFAGRNLDNVFIHFAKKGGFGGNLEDQKVRFKNMAKKSMAKTKRITLRVTEQDYELAHVKALKEGLPYQTLISSVIHRYLTGQFRDVAP